MQKQLDSLGSDHVGYSAKRFKAANGALFSVVGGRPFSDVSFIYISWLRHVLWISKLTLGSDHSIAEALSLAAGQCNHGPCD